MKIKDFNPASIFESMRAFNGSIFRFSGHLARLREGAKTAGMVLSPNEILNFKKKIEGEYKKSGLKDAYIRAALYIPSKETSVIVKKTPCYPEEIYKKGVCLKAAASRRPSSGCLLLNIKSSNFLSGVYAKLESSDTFEALILQNRGYVTEATVSNVFIVKAGSIFTPPVSDGLLDGITRQLIFRLALSLGIEIVQKRMTRHDLYNADECFLTNTTINVLPVVELDARVIGAGKPGAVTKKIMREFKKPPQ